MSFRWRKSSFGSKSTKFVAPGSYDGYTIKITGVSDKRYSSRLLHSFCDNRFRDLDRENIPGFYDRKASINVNGIKYNLELYDASGMEEFPEVRISYYLNINAILMVFSVVDPSSLDNIREKWIPEVRERSSTKIIILCALDIEKPWQVTFEQISRVEEKVGSLCTIFSSTKARIDVHQPFATAVKAYLLFAHSNSGVSQRNTIRLLSQINTQGRKRVKYIKNNRRKIQNLCGIRVFQEIVLDIRLELNRIRKEVNDVKSLFERSVEEVNFMISFGVKKFLKFSLRLERTPYSTVVFSEEQEASLQLYPCLRPFHIGLSMIGDINLNRTALRKRRIELDSYRKMVRDKVELYTIETQKILEFLVYCNFRVDEINGIKAGFKAEVHRVFINNKIPQKEITDLKQLYEKARLDVTEIREEVFSTWETNSSNKFLKQNHLLNTGVFRNLDCLRINYHFFEQFKFIEYNPSTDSMVQKVMMYVGETRDDQDPEGQGYLFLKTNKNHFQIIFEGDWKDGRRHGAGRQFHESNKYSLKYEGQFVGGLWQGRGICYDQDGGVREGKWMGGQLNKLKKSKEYRFSVYSIDKFSRFLNHANKIGSGGNALIYKVKLERKYHAAKIIDLGTVHKVFRESVMNSIRNSVRICASFRHHNIIDTYGMIVGHDSVGILMELMDTSLQHYINNNRGKLSMKKKIFILLETAFGMEYLHNLGIIHRDLKWGNVLIKGENEIKICDFDTAKDDESWRFNVTHTRTGIGTSFFLAPEILLKNYDKRVDVYSFGIMMFALLFECSNPYGETYECPGCRTKIRSMQPSVFGLHVLNCNLRPRIDPKQVKRLFNSSNGNKKYKKLMMGLIYQCWDKNPDKRPSFSEIADLIESEHAKIENCIVIHVSSFYDPSRFFTKQQKEEEQQQEQNLLITKEKRKVFVNELSHMIVFNNIQERWKEHILEKLYVEIDRENNQVMEIHNNDQLQRYLQQSDDHKTKSVIFVAKFDHTPRDFLKKLIKEKKKKRKKKVKKKKTKNIIRNEDNDVNKLINNPMIIPVEEEFLEEEELEVNEEFSKDEILQKKSKKIDNKMIISLSNNTSTPIFNIKDKEEEDICNLNNFQLVVEKKVEEFSVLHRMLKCSFDQLFHESMNQQQKNVLLQEDNESVVPTKNTSQDEKQKQLEEKDSEEEIEEELLAEEPLQTPFPTATKNDEIRKSFVVQQQQQEEEEEMDEEEMMDESEFSQIQDSLILKSEIEEHVDLEFSFPTTTPSNINIPIKNGKEEKIKRLGLISQHEEVINKVIYQQKEMLDVISSQKRMIELLQKSLRGKEKKIKELEETNIHLLDLNF